MTAQEQPRGFVIRETETGVWIAGVGSFTWFLKLALLYRTPGDAQRHLVRFPLIRQRCEIWSYGAALDLEAQP